MGSLHCVGGIAQQPPWLMKAEAPLCALLMGRGLQRHRMACGRGLQLSVVMKGSRPNEETAVCAASSACKMGTDETKRTQWCLLQSGPRRLEHSHS